MRATNMRNDIRQELATGGEDAANVPDAISYFEHRIDSRRQQTRNLIEGLAQAQTLVNESGQQMKTRARGPIPAGGSAGD